MGLKADLQKSLHEAAKDAAMKALPKPSDTLPKLEDFDGMALALAKGLDNLLEQIAELAAAVEKIHTTIPKAITMVGISTAASGTTGAGEYVKTTGTLIGDLEKINKKIADLKKKD